MSLLLHREKKYGEDGHGLQNDDCSALTTELTEDVRESRVNYHCILLSYNYNTVFYR